MFVALISAAALAAHGMPPGACDPAPLSPAAQAVAAPVLDAVAQARAREAALPPPRTDAERLTRMGELDQAPRIAFGKVDPSGLSPPDRKAMMAATWCPIMEIDLANQAALLAMLPPEGWFTHSRYGAEASQAAFHIVQHGTPELWRRFLPVLEKLAAQGEVDGQDYGMMYDRLAVTESRPQRFGSQLHCVAGRWTPYPLEDPGAVDARRLAFHFKKTYSAYLADMATNPPC